VGRVGELLEAIHDRSLIAAPAFVFAPACIEHAEILKAAEGAIRAKIEAIDDELNAVLGKAIVRNLKPAFLCDGETEVLVRGELREFIRVPQLYDVGGATIALREPGLRVAQRGGGVFVADENLGWSPLMLENDANLSMRLRKRSRSRRRARISSTD
jgi:hypothetical protein